MCTLKIRNVRICSEIEYPNLVKSMKICVQYMYGMSSSAGKLNIQNFEKSTENFVHYMYGMSRFVEKLNIQNCLEST